MTTTPAQEVMTPEDFGQCLIIDFDIQNLSATGRQQLYEAISERDAAIEARAKREAVPECDCKAKSDWEHVRPLISTLAVWRTGEADDLQLCRAIDYYLETKRW